MRQACDVTHSCLLLEALEHEHDWLYSKYNTNKINRDVFHEWEEEQQGLRWIIPHNTNASFFSNSQAQEEMSSVGPQGRFGRMPRKDLPESAGVCWGQHWREG